MNNSNPIQQESDYHLPHFSSKEEMLKYPEGRLILAISDNKISEIGPLIIAAAHMEKPYRGEVVQLLASSQTHMTEVDRINFVQTVLKLGTISKESLGFAVYAAASSGNKQLVEELLKQGDISSQQRGLAIDSACQNGDIETLKVLFKDKKRWTIPTFYINLLNSAPTPEIKELIQDNFETSSGM